MQSQSSICYCSSPNIALVKYWGKYHESQILPINDSLGLTLNTDDLSTLTICSFDRLQKDDEFLLNGKQVEVTKRMKGVLGRFREIARKLAKFQGLTDEEWNSYYFRIQSTNSFPTASGMASSASGFSCLATALNGLFGNILDEVQLSRLARWGSGSAARAVYGGLVKWCGVDEQTLLKKQQLNSEQLQKLSKKCISFSVKPASQLSYIKVVILLTQNKQKQVSSTLGMKLSMQTSELIPQRNRIASQRISLIMQLLAKIDEARKLGSKAEQYQLYSKFAEIVMRDSNQFHALCLDTYPPIFYLNQFSRQIIYMVDNIINKQSKRTKIAYSFDAGAHSFLFVHEDMLEDVVGYFGQQFGCRLEEYNQKGRDIVERVGNRESQFSDYKGRKIRPTAIWVTDVGRGAEKVIK